jgi:glycosyltransferase involved in cell wall biosynthesis
VGVNERSVVQVGPVTSMPGGIAAVIEQYIRMELGGRRSIAYASYWPGRPLRGLLSAGVFPVWALVRQRRSSTIVHVHLSEGGSFLREGLIVKTAALLGYTVAATLHGAGFVDYVRDSPASARRVLEACRVVFCLGQVHADVVGLLTHKTEPVRILNPVDLRRRGTGRTAPKPTVLFGGEVGTRKGVDRLLAAWPEVQRRVPDARLVVYGPVTGEVTLPQGIEYKGVLDREALRVALSEVTVACLPSRQEVLPMFILESLAEGTPVVATKAGEWRSFDGVADISWVDNDDATVVAELSEALIKALIGAHRVSSGTHAWLRENASTGAVANTLRRTYERISEASR